jgi:stage III sporulation protein AA
MADPVLPYLFQQGELWNTLIISPPGCGKTTLLRDLIRQVSDGTDTRQGQQVSVVDERSEIAGSYQGIPQNQVGIRTDVLDACPKTEGMMLLVRSMTPQVIAVDEIGSKEDLAALQRIAVCGTGVLATMHGYSLKDVEDKLGKSKSLFGRFLLLTFKDRKRSVRIYDGEKHLLQETVL